MIVSGSHSGEGTIDFSSAATSTPAARHLREMKICEFDKCGRTFFRVKGSGTVFCDQCRARLRNRAIAARQAQTQLNRQRGN